MMEFLTDNWESLTAIASYLLVLYGAPAHIATKLNILGKFLTAISESKKGISSKKEGK